jgi:hypothetical protein
MVWLVFFSTTTTVVAICCVATYFWYTGAQAQIAETHPVLLEWSAESVLLQLDRAQDEIAQIARTTKATSSN